MPKSRAVEQSRSRQKPARPGRSGEPPAGAAASVPRLDSPELYVNRELSWLEFNGRVLEEAEAADTPLLERLKFLAIVSSNLDEFFMIRVAGLQQQVAAGVTARDPSGLTAAEALLRISARTHAMVARQAECLAACLGDLRPHGLQVLAPEELAEPLQEVLRERFRMDVLPVLTPLTADVLSPLPVLPGSSLNLALALEEESELPPRMAIVPLPGNLPRFLPLSSPEGIGLVPLEQATRWAIEDLFPGRRVLASTVFRITRDADVAVDDDEAADLLSAMEEAVRARRRRAVARLEVSANSDHRVREWLMQWCEVGETEVYEIAGLMNARDVMDIVARPGYEGLRLPDWPPQPPQDLLETGELWPALQDRDVLLFHPYESFEPVVSMVELAADDPGVLAIKVTLYRTSADSPIVTALARAAESGKQVTVLVELRARFDEARNVTWARKLEEAGCYVIYGLAGLKTHAKLLLVIRREAHGIRRYVHCATGNYNDRTARLYSDIGLMTTDRGFALDAAAFFNLLTGYSQEVGWSRFAIAPTNLRQRLIELIEREIEASTPDQPGLIRMKVNSLQDTAICQALYRASRAGVKVLLNVRGICCLRPGVPGVSENVEVISIVDRFLEHARVFSFRNGGHEEVYLASADCMERNLDRRLEMLFPVIDPALRRRLVGILETCFADNVKARRMLREGRYERVVIPGPKVRAQETFYRRAVAAAKSGHQGELQLRPLVSPGDRE